MSGWLEYFVEGVVSEMRDAQQAATEAVRCQLILFKARAAGLRPRACKVLAFEGEEVCRTSSFSAWQCCGDHLPRPERGLRRQLSVNSTRGLQQRLRDATPHAAAAMFDRVLGQYARQSAGR